MLAEVPGVAREIKNILRRKIRICLAYPYTHGFPKKKSTHSVQP